LKFCPGFLLRLLVEDKLLLSEEKNSFDITAWKKPLIPFVVLTYVPFLLHFLLQVGGLPSVVGEFFLILLERR